MHDFVCFDGEIKSVLNAQIPAVSAAALYGAGVFTTVAIFNRKPFLWHLHAERLRDNAAKIGLDASAVDYKSLENDLFNFVAANRIINGRARVTLFDAGASDVWRFQTNRKIAILIVSDDAPEKPKKRLRLSISPFPVNSASPLASVKSCNYSENLLALKNAKANGFDEALRLNERGAVVSAAMANVFWTKGKNVFTPALETGALNGTTRRFIIDSAASLGFEIVETVARVDEVFSADEMFLTSASLNVCPVESLNEKKFKNAAARLKKHLLAVANA